MPNKTDDVFQSEGYLKIGKHDQEILELDKKISKIEERVKDDILFGNTVVNTINSQSSTKSYILNSLIKEMETNKDFKEMLVKIVEESDRSLLKKIFKHIYGWVGTVIAIIITAVVTAIVSR